MILLPVKAVRAKQPTQPKRQVQKTAVTLLLPLKTDSSKAGHFGNASSVTVNREITIVKANAMAAAVSGSANAGHAGTVTSMVTVKVASVAAAQMARLMRQSAARQRQKLMQATGKPRHS